ncbi:hypothetical protein [Clostridium baratii]|uniref:hypothetical protein n=1 Tax=Clostridium baratii TaxID=1561 RepID=UPI001C21E717|nr:hypothetical protein [Clostridium baratii]
MSHIGCAGLIWRKAYKYNGILALDDTRRNNCDRPHQSKITKDEIIKNNVLKAFKYSRYKKALRFLLHMKGEINYKGCFSLEEL